MQGEVAPLWLRAVEAVLDVMQVGFFLILAIP